MDFWEQLVFPRVWRVLPVQVYELFSCDEFLLKQGVKYRHARLPSPVKIGTGKGTWHRQWHFY